MSDIKDEKSLDTSASVTPSDSQEKLPEITTVNAIKVADSPEKTPETTTSKRIDVAESKPESTETLSNVEAQPVKPPPYSGFSPGRRRFILAVTTTAGFFGPLAGGIYLPALPVLKQDFKVSGTAINASVSVFMAMFAVGVSLEEVVAGTVLLTVM